MELELRPNLYWWRQLLLYSMILGVKQGYCLLRIHSKIDLIKTRFTEKDLKEMTEKIERHFNQIGGIGFKINEKAWKDLNNPIDERVTQEKEGEVSNEMIKETLRQSELL